MIKIENIDFFQKILDLPTSFLRFLNLLYHYIYKTIKKLILMKIFFVKR